MLVRALPAGCGEQKEPDRRNMEDRYLCWRIRRVLKCYRTTHSEAHNLKGLLYALKEAKLDLKSVKNSAAMLEAREVSGLTAEGLLRLVPALLFERIRALGHLPPCKRSDRHGKTIVCDGAVLSRRVR